MRSIRRPRRPGALRALMAASGGPARLVTHLQSTVSPPCLADATGPGYNYKNRRRSRLANYVFVTGGVVSSLGKGITAASIGSILRSRGLPVYLQKLDPYLNVDPGTMSPYQHGEVFVTDDGAETDLDLGHYERFVDENLSAASNVTTGKVYSEVIAKERRGDY